jgi:uncharacterized protein (TIGR03086 family)
MTDRDATPADATPADAAARDAAADLGPAADAVKRVLPGVADDQFGEPTPCPDWTVGALLVHLLGLTVAFRKGARKEPDLVPGGPPPPDGADLPADWRAELPARLDALVEAWRDQAAWQGETSVGGATLPAAAMGLVALNEVVTHGWDLARATGQPYEVDPATVAAVHGFVAQFNSPQGVPGLFGPPVEVPADAAPLHRVLGLVGRDPAWTP